MSIRLGWLLMASWVFSLTACGGGGGYGGYAGVTASVPTSTQPSTSPAAKGPAVNFQAANSTVTYQPASATMAVPDAGSAGALAVTSGKGGAITLTTNASGNLAGAVFNIPTTGSAVVVSFPSPEYAALINQPTAQLPQVASFLYSVFGIPESPPSPYGGTTNLLFTQWAGNNSLSSLGYGIWGASDTTGLAGPAGTYVLGNLTPAAAVPATGTATFTGSTIGVGSINGGAIQALYGDAQIVANFANQSVITNFTHLGTQIISAKAATNSLPDLSGTSTLAGTGYSGPISGGGLTGTVNGNFYGSAAQETGGVWQASGAGSTWIGSFGAK